MNNRFDTSKASLLKIPDNKIELNLYIKKVIELIAKDEETVYSNENLNDTLERLTIEINRSASSKLDPELVDWMRDALNKTTLAPEEFLAEMLAIGTYIKYKYHDRDPDSITMLNVIGDAPGYINYKNSFNLILKKIRQDFLNQTLLDARVCCYALRKSITEGTNTLSLSAGEQKHYQAELEAVITMIDQNTKQYTGYIPPAHLVFSLNKPVPSTQKQEMELKPRYKR